MKRIVSFYALFALLSLSAAPGASLCAQDKNIAKKDFLRQGNRMYKRAEYPLSDSLYATAVALDSAYATGWYNLGNSLYSGAQSPEQAQAAWMQSLSLTADEDRADILYNLGGVEMDRKNYAEAVKLYKDALRRNPSDEQARYNLALAQTLLKEQQQNQQQNDQNQNQDQNNPDNNPNNDKNDQNQNQDQDQNDPDNNQNNNKNDQNDQNQNQDQNDPDSNPNNDKNDQNQNQDQNDPDNNPNNDNDKNDRNNNGNNNDRNQNPNNDDNSAGGGNSSGQNTPQPLSQSDEQMLRAIDRQEQGTQEKVKGKKADGAVILSTKDW